MFDHMSRYYAVETGTIQLADGREVAYKRRRFLPDAQTLPILAEVNVTQGERLDLIAARAFGVSEFFWQICDANAAMNPFELTERRGEAIRIPVPQPTAT